MNRRNFIKTSTLAATAASLAAPLAKMLAASDDLPVVNSLPIEPSIYSGDFVWSAEGKTHMRKTYNKSAAFSYCQDTHVKFWNQCRWSGHDLYGDGSLPASVAWDHDKAFNQMFDRGPLVDWNECKFNLILDIAKLRFLLGFNPHEGSFYLSRQDEEEIRYDWADPRGRRYNSLIADNIRKMGGLRGYYSNSKYDLAGVPTIWDADETHFEGLPAFW